LLICFADVTTLDMSFAALLVHGALEVQREVQRERGGGGVDLRGLPERLTGGGGVDAAERGGRGDDVRKPLSSGFVVVAEFGFAIDTKCEDVVVIEEPMVMVGAVSDSATSVIAEPVASESESPDVPMSTGRPGYSQPRDDRVVTRARPRSRGGG
jgi:hypothetical protein